MTDEKKFPFTDRDGRVHLDPKGPGWPHGPVEFRMRRLLANNQPCDDGDELVFETKIESMVPTALKSASEWGHTVVVAVELMRKFIEKENAYERLRNDPRALRNRLVELTKKARPTRVAGAGCRCLACVSDGKQHASDCAVHNAPASRPGPCDCGDDDSNGPSLKCRCGANVFSKLAGTKARYRCNACGNEYEAEPK